MLFNSYIFLFVFLPLVLLGWWQLKETRLRLIYITLGSYIFYGWWSWKFVPLMIASTTVDYLAGYKIAATEDPRLRKRWLAGSLTFNLLILGIFKYCGFFGQSVNDAAHLLGLGDLVPVIHLVLPIGISFYTFNSMSYTIDIYRRVVRPAESLLHFSAFVALFPHLVAGPIVRYSDIEDQFRALKKRVDWDEINTGLKFFTIGLAKKLLIADRLADVVNAYWNAPRGQGAVAAWIAALGYSFQMYFDFSAYSEMAVGLAHFLGIQFPINFNSPYKAENISDFWRRWHISLSTWLRDYLFIPLGGSRGSAGRTALNLIVTMFLGGLWHGAAWTYVFFGLCQGLLLAGHQFCKRRGLTPSSVVVNRALTYLTFVVGLVIFRSDSLPQGFYIIGSLFGAHGLGPLVVSKTYLLQLVIAAALSMFGPNVWELRVEFKPRYAWAMAATVAVAVLYLEKESPFLYFQF